MSYKRGFVKVTNLSRNGSYNVQEAGIEVHGMVSSLLDEAEDRDDFSEENEEDIKYFGGTIYNGPCICLLYIVGV